jgi:hypothetical protein
MGMTTDDDTSLVNRYRASVEDVQSPNLDRLVKAAAVRYATRTRVARRARDSFFVLAVVSATIGVAWHVSRSNPHSDSLAVTDYGKIEGLSTSYLLQAGTQQYSGPGTLEGDI